VPAASGEPSAYCVEGLSMPEDELQRIIDRAGLDASPTDLHPLVFKDRHGEATPSLPSRLGGKGTPLKEATGR
jgi:hypothetical protein